MKFSTYAFGLLAMAGTASACDSIVDIACGLDDFSTLCTAVQLAGLVDAVSGDGPLTVFAPTNQAFANLGDLLDVALNDITLLTDILLFHVVPAKVGAADLECSELVTMANGQNSRTVCRHSLGEAIFQKGGNNPSVPDAPQIVATDIETCQGFIHVVDEVLLPGILVTGEPETPDLPPPPEDCSTIAEIACGNDDFSTLCAAVGIAGLGEALSGAAGDVTVFAPTNAAFAELGSALDDVVANVPLLTTILLTHVTAGVVFEADLQCAGLVEMLSGEDTRTVCAHPGPSVFQKGRGNSSSDRPKIISTDIRACNGVIHVLDGVILP